MRERTWRVPARMDPRLLAWPTALRAAAAIAIPLTPPRSWGTTTSA